MEETSAATSRADMVSRVWAPWPVIALAVLTVANYAWQVPYYEHFYGRYGHAPHGLTIPLVLTFAWFAAGTGLLVTRRRGAVPVLSAYLVVEALFYLVHNLSGALGHDLPAGDPVLLIASVLGYVNVVAAIAFLVWLFRHRAGTSPPAATGKAAPSFRPGMPAETERRSRELL